MIAFTWITRYTIEAAVIVGLLLNAIMLAYSVGLRGRP